MIPILYEDECLVVCRKPIGLLSQPDASGEGEDMLTLLTQQLTRPGAKPPTVGLIHRLDRGVGGVMVFSKRPDIASSLSIMVANRTLTKEYLAAVHGAPDAPRGEWIDLLYKDAAKNKSFVVDRARRGVKEAKLSYRLIDTQVDTPYGIASLLHITLGTGRTHQIRVQCSHRGMPLLGDGKYGARDHGIPIGLWSYRLCFAHPRKKGVTVDVRALPEEHEVFRIFGEIEV